MGSVLMTFFKFGLAHIYKKETSGKYLQGKIFVGLAEEQKDKLRNHRK